MLRQREARVAKEESGTREGTVLEAAGRPREAGKRGER